MAGHLAEVIAAAVAAARNDRRIQVGNSKRKIVTYDAALSGNEGEISASAGNLQ